MENSYFDEQNTAFTETRRNRRSFLKTKNKRKLIFGGIDVLGESSVLPMDYLP
jgi:hypothetical protein